MAILLTDKAIHSTDVFGGCSYSQDVKDQVLTKHQYLMTWDENVLVFEIWIFHVSGTKVSQQ